MSEEGIDKGATIENFRSLESGILSMLFQSLTLKSRDSLEENWKIFRSLRLEITRDISGRFLKLAENSLIG